MIVKDVRGLKEKIVKPHVFFIVGATDEALPEDIQHIPEITKIVSPVENRSTSGFAQVSRLLLPAIIDAENVLISDIDYIPLPSWYYGLSGGHSPKRSMGHVLGAEKDFFLIRGRRQVSEETRV